MCMKEWAGKDIFLKQPAYDRWHEDSEAVGSELGW